MSILKIIAAALLLAGTAHAKVSIIEVTGVFNDTQGKNAQNLNTFATLLSQPFTMRFSYDSSLTDLIDDDDDRAVYIDLTPAIPFVLTSNGVTLSDTVSGLFVSGDLGGQASYGTDGLNDIVDSTGLVLPNNLDEFGFSLFHPVSDAAVDFLDPGMAVDPLPTDPFFIGEPLDGAVVRVELTFDPPSAFEQELQGSVTRIRVVPEPGSALMLALSGVALLRRRRRAG